MLVPVKHNTLAGHTYSEGRAISCKSQKIRLPAAHHLTSAGVPNVVPTPSLPWLGGLVLYPHGVATWRVLNDRVIRAMETMVSLRWLASSVIRGCHAHKVRKHLHQCILLVKRKAGGCVP